MRRFWPLAAVLLTLWIDALLWRSGDAGPVGWVLSMSIPHLFVLPTAVAAALALRKRRWAMVGINGAVAVGQVFGPMGLCLGRPVEGEPDLRVLSYNVAGFWGGGQGALADVVRRIDPDVLCFQEASGDRKFGPPKLFEARLPEYRFLDLGGMVLASKRPLRRKDATIFPSHLIPFHWNVQEAAIDVGGREVRIVNIHQLPDLWEPDAWPKLPLLLDVERRRRLRDEEIDEVLRRVRSKPGPVIVCGDFNQQPFDPRYRRLAAELTDTFRATGTGFGFSLTASAPTKRVDYVWTRGLRPLRTRVLPLANSDHMPLLAEIALEP